MTRIESYVGPLPAGAAKTAYQPSLKHLGRIAKALQFEVAALIHPWLDDTGVVKARGAPNAPMRELEAISSRHLDKGAPARKVQGAQARVLWHFIAEGKAWRPLLGEAKKTRFPRAKTVVDDVVRAEEARRAASEPTQSS